jgi:quinol monooxygenase YgiN
VYVLAPFKIRFTFPDGRTAVRETRAGEVLFSEAVTHASENIGTTDAHGILVELKSGASRPTTETLTAVTFIRGAPGKEQDIQRELLALTAPTRAEPGSIQYDLYQSLERPHEFMRFEVWRSPEALERHKASPHLKASFERRKDQGWMTDITLWRRVDR